MHKSYLSLVWKDWNQCAGALLSQNAKWFLRGSLQLVKAKLFTFNVKKVYSFIINGWWVGRLDSNIRIFPHKCFIEQNSGGGRYLLFPWEIQVVMQSLGSSRRTDTFLTNSRWSCCCWFMGHTLRTIRIEKYLLFFVLLVFIINEF